VVKSKFKSLGLQSLHFSQKQYHSPCYGHQRVAEMVGKYHSKNDCKEVPSGHRPDKWGQFLLIQTSLMEKMPMNTFLNQNLTHWDPVPSPFNTTVKKDVFFFLNHGTFPLKTVSSTKSTRKRPTISACQQGSFQHVLAVLTLLVSESKTLNIWEPQGLLCGRYVYWHLWIDTIDTYELKLRKFKIVNSLKILKWFFKSNI
jgi:hypothetical protein